MADSILVAIWRVNRTLPLLLAILLLSNAGIYAWVAYGLSVDIAALERRYIDLQSRTRTARQDPNAARQDRWRQAERDLQDFRQAIPTRTEFTGLISELFAMSGSAGLELDRIGYKPTTLEEGNLLRYDLVFSVRGGYRQLKTFIHALEQSSRIMAIEGISLGSQDSAGQGAVSLSIRLSTYFASDPQNES